MEYGLCKNCEFPITSNTESCPFCDINNPFVLSFEELEKAQEEAEFAIHKLVGKTPGVSFQQIAIPQKISTNELIANRYKALEAYKNLHSDPSSKPGKKDVQ